MLTDIIQTFFVDPSAVNQSSEVFITSIEVFFKEKPVSTKNGSGAIKPGVNLFLCDVQNQTPKVESRVSDIIRAEYDDIYTFSDASVSTVFAFETPVLLKTNRFYGFVLKFDDQFGLWVNQQGDTLLGSNMKSSGSTTLPNGRLYESNLSNNVLKYLSNSQLKFKINIAKFQANTVTHVLGNQDYEFLSLSNMSGHFVGGETVYPISSPAAGTVNLTSGSPRVTGVGTSFTAVAENTDLVFTSGNTEFVTRVDAIISDTELFLTEPVPVTNAAAQYYPALTGEVYKFDSLLNSLYLKGSTANSTAFFSNTLFLKGEISGATANVASVGGLKISKFLPALSINGPAYMDTKYEYVIADEVVTSSNNDYKSLVKDELNDTDGYIWSKSIELAGNLLNDKSFNVRGTFSINQPSNALFSYPVVDLRSADVFVFEYNISPTTIEAGIDTETRNNGISRSRYLSNKTFFANNRFAEDAVVYINAYKPLGTDIQVYGKFHNSADTDAFEDKLWTPLELVENKDRFSGSKTDLIQYTYTLPAAPESLSTLAGKAQANGSAVVLTTNDQTSAVNANTVIKLYDPMFPENHHVRAVESVNSTAIVLDEPVAVTQAGLNIDILKYPTAAFRNKDNDYVLRYYSENRSVFDTFDTIQIKICPVSNNSSIAPEIDYLQFVGTSA